MLAFVCPETDALIAEKKLNPPFACTSISAIIFANFSLLSLLDQSI